MACFGQILKSVTGKSETEIFGFFGFGFFCFFGFCFVLFFEDLACCPTVLSWSVPTHTPLTVFYFLICLFVL